MMVTRVLDAERKLARHDKRASVARGLGVARALLPDRPVLILDEPTAHLDADNESLLRAAVLSASTGKTLIWITHRLTGLGAFDEVITLHHGRVMAGQASRHPRRALAARGQTQGPG